MTKRIEITDEMIKRACKAYHDGPPEFTPSMRAAIDAALNLPPEPEIPVSEGMLDAGVRAWNAWVIGHVFDGEAMSIAERIYRAMRRAALSERY